MRYTTRKSASGLIASGAATVTLSHSMKISRRAAMSGSLRSDWKKVGNDVEKAIGSVRRELERA